MSNKILLCIALTLLPGSILAQTRPQLSLPVDCTLNEDCWIVNHVDVDPSDKIADFTCAAKTYNDHKGTDIAIRSRAEMDKGVAVLAARDGTVLRVRNGESDTSKSKAEIQTITAKNKDCGNGVLIKHENELQTFYCHMKKDSITVKTGDKVQKGQKIGEIGHSGRTEYPHLHFSVIWEGGHIDPFTSHLKEEGCGKLRDNMWEPDISYQPLTLYNGGFSNTVPNFKNIENGATLPQKLPQSSEAFLYWIAMFHAQEGDEITMTILDPDGQIFREQTNIMEKSRMRQYFYTGRKTTNIKLKPGTYKGITTIKRENIPTIVQEHTIQVE